MPWAKLWFDFLTPFRNIFSRDFHYSFMVSIYFMKIDPASRRPTLVYTHPPPLSQFTQGNFWKGNTCICYCISNKATTNTCVSFQKFPCVNPDIAFLHILKELPKKVYISVQNFARNARKFWGVCARPLVYFYKPLSFTKKYFICLHLE